MTAAAAGTYGMPATTSPAIPAPPKRTFWTEVRDQPWTFAGITVLIGYCLFPFLWLVRL